MPVGFSVKEGLLLRPRLFEENSGVVLHRLVIGRSLEVPPRRKNGHVLVISKEFLSTTKELSTFNFSCRGSR